jgi:hypothetical protein
MTRIRILGMAVTTVLTGLAPAVAGAQVGTVVCLTTSGGGQTRTTELVVTGAALAAGSFEFNLSAVGETTDLQPVTGFFIRRPGGANIYFGLEGPPTPNHDFALKEGGRVSAATLAGDGVRMQVRTSGQVDSKPITASAVLGPCR